MNDDIHDLAGAYALDALDDLERARFEAHLARCDTCRRDVADFRATATHLAVAATSNPPPALRGQVLAAIGGVRQERPMAGNRRFLSPTRSVMMAAACLAVLAIGILAVQLSGARSSRDRADQIAAVLTAADAETTAMESADDGVSGRLVWSATLGRSVIVLDGLADPGAEHGYQLWFVVDGDAVPAGVFRPTDHRVVAEAGTVPDRVEVIGVTVEPVGGSAEPTTAMLLTGAVAAG